jgi:hypothetical protein
VQTVETKTVVHTFLSAAREPYPRKRGTDLQTNVRNATMLRRMLQVAPVAALLVIGTPQTTAEAMDLPSLQSDDAIVLVGEDRRRGGEGRSFRSERGDRGDGPRIRRDDGRDREFRRHRRLDDRDRWRFFGRPYDDDYRVGCGSLRRRALATDSAYWWRRYRECLRGV